jgi:hypothetical protein
VFRISNANTFINYFAIKLECSLFFDGSHNPTDQLSLAFAKSLNGTPSGSAARYMSDNGHFDNWISSSDWDGRYYINVDMTNEGGGYDYYPITNGITVAYKTEYNSGTALGLDLVYPRKCPGCHLPSESICEFCKSFWQGPPVTILLNQNKLFKSFYLFDQKNILFCLFSQAFLL